MFRLGLLATGLIAIATPGAASARDFLAFQSTTPILYRYAACALAQDEPTVEAQLARCAELKKSLTKEADGILLKFHASDRRKADLHLDRGIHEIDRDAKLARDQRKTVPTSIIAYINCLGEKVMQTDDYQNGIAVDYVGIEEECANEHVLSVTSVSSEEELRRIEVLYRRFARIDRYVDNSSRLGEGIASTGDWSRAPQQRRISRSPTAVPFVVLMDGSFLNLSRLPADKAGPDD